MMQAIIHNQLRASFTSDTLSSRKNGEEHLHVVVVESPVRVDLSGGWSDTPPICFEHAAAVHVSHSFVL